LVQHKAFVSGVHVELGVKGRQFEVGQLQLSGLVLQLTIIVGNTDRADVVAFHEEELDYVAPVSDKALRRGRNPDALFHFGGTRGEELGAALHFHYAKAAGTDVAQPLQVAQSRDADAVLFCRGEQSLVRSSGHVLAVYNEGAYFAH
jgi:hypothetical protein